MSGGSRTTCTPGGHAATMAREEIMTSLWHALCSVDRDAIGARVMNPTDDMDAPVTRRELREELASFKQAFEERIDAIIDAKLEQKLEQKLAHFANVILEAVRAQIAALDDKYGSLPLRIATFETQYGDLPARVATLERKVFAPGPGAAAKRRAPRRR
jgi:hypothetical protein